MLFYTALEIFDCMYTAHASSDKITLRHRSSQPFTRSRHLVDCHELLHLPGFATPHHCCRVTVSLVTTACYVAALPHPSLYRCCITPAATTTYGRVWARRLWRAPNGTSHVNTFPATAHRALDSHLRFLPTGVFRLGHLMGSVTN
eukprot:scaffold92895_cov21-Prasinocladus_malaysianus.AAC.2